MNARSHRVLSKRLVRASGCVVEHIEPRQLLSVRVSNGVLTVTGSPGDDQIQLQRAIDVDSVMKIFVRGISGQADQSVPAASVTSVVVDAGNGNDRVELVGGDGHAMSVLDLPATLRGGAGNDVLTAGSQPASLEGGAGNDTLTGSTGDDTFAGGDGDDTVSYFGRSASVSAAISGTYNQGLGTYNLTGSGGEAGEHDVFTEVEGLIGGDGDDGLGFDTPDADHAPAELLIHLDGSAGKDHLSVSTAENGADSYGQPKVLANGGDGDDTLYINLGGTNVTLAGGNGNDTFSNNGDGYPTIRAGAGIDTFNWDSLIYHNFTMPLGLERLIASDAAHVFGSNDDNQITIVSGSVDGRGGNDTITILSRGSARGGSGNDSIIGGSSASTLAGDDGNDTITGKSGNDTINGGADDDQVDAGDGNDSVCGGAGNDRLIGGSGRDTLRGDDGDDRLYGNGGSDFLYGGAGKDRLYGSAGNDLLDGGSGTDYLYGGDDNDRAMKDKKDRVVNEIEEMV